MPRFDTTRWSLVISAGEDDDEAKSRAALAQLCHIYWRPIFAFICQRGHSVDDAKDLTQDFFVRILEGDLFSRADQERGRFRSFLLRALKNFLMDDRSRRTAKKRGGEMRFISWDDWIMESPSRLSLPSKALAVWSAERLFDVRWAATIVERALSRLREECESRGRRRVFDVLGFTIAAERAEIRYDDLGRSLKLPGQTIKRLISQMRRRYRELLRREVAKTVATSAEVEEELRYLCAILKTGYVPSEDK